MSDVSSGRKTVGAATERERVFSNLEINIAELTVAC